jgi:hypothetical protein
MKIQTEKRAESLLLSLKKKRRSILVLLFIIIGLEAFSGVVAGEDRKLSMAPVNKAFLEYISTPPKVLHYTARDVLWV